jgi:ferredoxin-NADP reductase
VTSTRSRLAARTPSSAHDVYLGGRSEMMNADERSLCEAGVAKRHIHHESFAF